MCCGIGAGLPRATEASSPVPTVRLLVRGTVQGVGYRWFVLREAQRLGVLGWVSNLPDGSVEVVAEGSEGALARLEQALTRGPSTAHVTAVGKKTVPHELGDLNSFDVR